MVLLAVPNGQERQAATAADPVVELCVPAGQAVHVETDVPELYVPTGQTSAMSFPWQ